MEDKRNSLGQSSGLRRSTDGFKLEAESDIYRQPADPRTANVFSPAIRGKTDQFMLRFRKPG